MMNDTQISETFLRIAERFGREFGTPLPERLLEIGDREKGWNVRLNPTDAETGGVQPFTASVKWNGWPAGIIGPDGGVIAAGDAANEETFLIWIHEGS